MALLICKRCKKIIASRAEPCPYCGEANPGDPGSDSNSKQAKIKSVVIGFFIVAFLSVFLIYSSSRNATRPGQSSETNAVIDAATASKQNCLVTECPAGTRAVTYTTRQEPFYSCKSDELSAYANYVLSVMVAQVQLAGTPEISGKTGEPVVQGQDKSVLDQYRAKAGVSSFEEAISKCYRGTRNLNVLVLYSPAKGNSIYVAAEEDQNNKFWMPKARLIKR